jgi:sugar phosphate isomerase/epimerase
MTFHMTTRRNFLHQSGLAILAGLALPKLGKAAFDPFYGASARPAGLQLYTLGKLMTDDPAGALKQVAAIGYKEVESAGSSKGNFYGYEPKEFRKLVSDNGLHWRSAHVGGASFRPEQVMKMAKNATDSAQAKAYLDRMKGTKSLNLKDNYKELADKAAEGGLTYLVCSSIPVATLDEIKEAAEIFSKTGEACKKVGVQFAYHNHVTEFDTIGGHRPFDYILANTDKDEVKMELDLAWATKANQDPVELFKQHPGRFPCWHVKDLTKDTKQPTEIGAGYIDFKRIFEHANESGMKYYFVEQDGAPKPLDDIKMSYQNLQKLAV